jgi:hypothetical protein
MKVDTRCNNSKITAAVEVIIVWAIAMSLYTVVTTVIAVMMIIITTLSICILAITMRIVTAIATIITMEQRDGNGSSNCSYTDVWGVSNTRNNNGCCDSYDDNTYSNDVNSNSNSNSNSDSDIKR